MTATDEMRKAADQWDHDAEYNMSIADRWSPERQAGNNRRINRARQLRDQADEMDRAVRRAASDLLSTEEPR